MQLTTVPVKNNSKEYEDFVALYHTAFPPDELIPEEYFQASIRVEGTAIMAYYTGDIFCGFTFIIEEESFLFLYFFAVNPKLRSRGFGSEIIRNYLMKKYPGKPIILNVEIPDESAENNELRLRRIAFYQRLGFVQLNYRFNDERVVFQVLSTSPEVNISDYTQFLKSLYGVQNLRNTVHVEPYNENF